MKRTHVVAAIIFNQNKSQIFITQRLLHLHQGGYWEFPGGKVEDNESAEQAIVRELFEEIGIKVTELQPFDSFNYNYPDKALYFDFFTVTQFHHHPFGKEGQIGKWVSLTELSNYAFPAANQLILDRLISVLANP